jgi:hypothetical protein
MKRFLLSLLLIAVLTGCTRRYIITLTSGNRITTHGKPKLQNGAYVFKDSTGQRSAVSAARVREVAPASMAGESYDSGFGVTPSK